jgi:signal transduction histidine kinase
MHQLFSNLIGNAIKFSDENPLIEISCQKADHEEVKNSSQLNDSSEYYKLVIKDHGIGFDPQYSEQVFKLFRRLNNNRYGTGIGLALCKKIAENHDGDITVDSKPGEGTEFTIFLPLSTTKYG